MIIVLCILCQTRYAVEINDKPEEFKCPVCGHDEVFI